MSTKSQAEKEEEIYRFKKDNHCTAKETAAAFHISCGQVDNICSKWALIEIRKDDPLFVYVGKKMRIYNALRRSGIKSVAELQALSRKEVESIHDIGASALREIFAKPHTIDQ